MQYIKHMALCVAFAAVSTPAFADGKNVMSLSTQGAEASAAGTAGSTTTGAAGTTAGATAAAGGGIIGGVGVAAGVGALVVGAAIASSGSGSDSVISTVTTAN